MKHDIIKTDNYLLVVDESEIKVGDWYYVPRTNKAYKCEYDPTELEMEKRFGVREVIAHLPLNGSPILQGVDLLPALEDDVDVEKKAHAAAGYPKHEGDREKFYIKGYTQALQDNKDKKYTEEDIYKAIQYGREVHYTNDQPFIQSLSQPKMPIGFECVMEKDFRYNDDGEPFGFKVHNSDKITTTTTPEGHTQWVGKYIYEVK